MLRIVQLNLAFDPHAGSADALLDRYHTLTGWSRAVASAGASVLTIQRFSRDADLLRDGCAYRLVADGEHTVLGEWDRPHHAIAAVAAAAPDLVHVNGLMFPGAIAALRETLPRTTAIVLQDHSGAVPRVLPWPLDRWTTARWRESFLAVDACSFTATALADRWRGAGLPEFTPILEIPEASTTVTPIDRRRAIEGTGMTGRPALLWVGRLEPTKDPLTLLDALERALPALADARCTMIFEGGRLEPDVRGRVAASPLLGDRVTLLGAVPHDRIAAYYSAADVFVSASRHEGSGYALIEAMACGVAPCVSEIPASRALVGAIGRTWRAGDADDCASALRAVSDPAQRPTRDAVRAHFASSLAWSAIGALTVRSYAAIVDRRRATR